MTRREQALKALEIMRVAYPDTVPRSVLSEVPLDVLIQLRSMGEITSYFRDTRWTLVGGVYDLRILEEFGPLVVMYVFGIILNERQAIGMYDLREELLKTSDPEVPVPLIPRVRRPFSHWIGFPAAVFHAPTLPDSYDQEAIEGKPEFQGFPVPSREDYNRRLNDWISFSDWCMKHGWRPTDRPKWWFVCDTEQEERA